MKLSASNKGCLETVVRSGIAISNAGTDLCDQRHGCCYRANEVPMHRSQHVIICIYVDDGSLSTLLDPLLLL